MQISNIEKKYDVKLYSRQNSILLVLILLIELAAPQIFPDANSHKKIVQTANITNQIIEENEFY